MEEEIDLFEHPELIPPEVQSILDTFPDDGDGYENCRALEAKLKPFGYTFEWYLDAQPFNLKKI